MKRLLILLAACHHDAAPKPVEPAYKGTIVGTIDVTDTDTDVEPVEAGQEGDDTIDFHTQGTERDVLAEAMQTFASMKTSAYVHKTNIDAASGRFEFDCSGFVGYVLAESQPRALEELRHATVKRPLAKHFVQYFQSLPEDSAWHSIARASDLQPGDVIAWLKPDDVVSKNTGHVMIATAKPRRDPKHSDIWIVPIIDSTAVPHGKSDSRRRTATPTTGLGTGDVLLVVDESGAPIGYRWSRGKKAHVHLTTIALAGLHPR